MKAKRILSLLAAAGLLSAAPALAEENDPVREIFRHGAPAPFSPGKATRVERGLIQLEIAPGIVLSAGAGAEFLVTPPSADGGPWLHVGAGPVTLANLAHDSIRPLPAGSYRLDAQLGESSGDGASDGVAPLASNIRQGFQFGDYIMVRQQEYLNSLTISVAPLNQAISSFLTGLFRRTP